MKAWLPRRADRVRWGLAVALMVVAAVLPPASQYLENQGLIESARFEIVLGVTSLILALWAVSYNLMLGYAGMVSFAHAAYYGVGAYTVAILLQRFQLSYFVALAVAPLVAAAIGVATGLVALRAVRLYFSLLTLAISQLLYSIAEGWYSVTGGDNGINGITTPDQLSDYPTLYYFVAAIVGVSLLVIFLLVRSPFGAALLAIRENRERARSIGINVKAYELAVYTIAATFAGLAGGLFPLVQPSVVPSMLYWTENATPVVVTLLGGVGSFLGPGLGAFIYTGLQNSLSRDFPYQLDVILGAIVLGVVLIVPGGFASVPELVARLRRRIVGDGEAPDVETEGEAIEMIDVGRALQAHAIQAEEIGKGKVLLNVADVSRNFGGLRAVEHVNLEIHEGDRHAIIGPNGAGKSTLFNMITGRLRPSSGRIWFDGRDITRRPAHLIAKAGIGRAFQVTMIFPRLSVRQNLQYAMLAHRGRTVQPWGIADRIYRDEAIELLGAVGLGPYSELPAGQLSHGDQRAIELAISLALGSRMILLDEPTAGMSAFETRKAMELVRRIATERNLTLLFCEHDMNVVFGTARMVTVMHQGRVLTQGTPEQVRADPQVQAVYLGELDMPADEEATGA
ncbi:MAG TPA: branched-chain amino acid ABC transporter ATP-binding protein/permease [Candidatus Dormibacteraeota bacterium]|nr:branched-chain amino acid ABC transporter ATP-binding protein/permease [Candidatus Dormibacteraeota bacterium]